MKQNYSACVPIIQTAYGSVWLTKETEREFYAGTLAERKQFIADVESIAEVEWRRKSLLEYV